ncbi:alpha-amylase family glycosyl hydrolase [Luteolibacter soli]|uniref:Alpha-amylase n=1 Tax=Luteolibacter soli TaxID=3135280 RepID=A0ABU9B3S8_9BACT
MVHDEDTGEDVELGILAGSDTEFRSETLYFLVLDRFAVGNPDKVREEDEMFDPTHQDWHRYWGGDLQGVIDKLDYLQSFGVTAIWTTPLFEQVRSMTVGDTPRAPIHGYWTSDFKRINPRWMNDPSEKHLFDREDTVFDKLLVDLHGRGMKFVLDIVCNHSSPQTSEGKGRLYDDGKLVADFDNDVDHWYHHYGETQDWNDEWQVQNCELAGLATFNENNILFRNYIKDAIAMWIRKGVDALRVDTVKHMPLWFWQEFTADMTVANPNLFRFGEWIHSRPDDPRVTEFANKSGMSILDFAYCNAVQRCLAQNEEAGFQLVQQVLDQDGNYSGATELVTFIENHDLPRFQSLGASNEMMDLALVLLMTSRGVPCLYYGCEQYLHNDTNGGEDPYNRPMLENWEPTEATRRIGILAKERKRNQAFQWGCHWPKWVDADSYVYLRQYRDSYCLVFLNRGGDRTLRVDNVEFPDGDHECLITGQNVHVENGVAEVELPSLGSIVLSKRGRRVTAQTIIRLQVNGAPTQPGDRVVVVGDCPELGCWDLQKAYELQCVNSNTWFGELPLNESAGRVIGYKFVVFAADRQTPPQRENRAVRRRLVIPEGTAKWRDRWES